MAINSFYVTEATTNSITFYYSVSNSYTSQYFKLFYGTDKSQVESSSVTNSSTATMAWSASGSSGKYGTKTLTSSASNTVYYLKLWNSSSSISGSGSTSNIISAYTGPVLDAPTNLLAIPSENTVELSWDAVSNAVGYVVTLNSGGITIGEGSNDIIISCDTNRTTVTGLGWRHQYFWYVKACGDQVNYGDSQNSDLETFRTIDAMENSEPMDISRVASSLGPITVNGDAYNYRAMASDIDLRRGGFGNGYTLVLKVSSTSSLSNVGMVAVFLKDNKDNSYYTPVNFQAATVQADGDYYIITSTINKYYDYSRTYPGFAIYTTEPVEITGLEVVSYTRGSVDQSNNIVFNYPTLALKLDLPTNLSATNITSTGATLHWDSVDNASDYKIEYRQSGATDWTEDQQ